MNLVLAHMTQLLGSRVRAPGEIFYVESDVTIAAGTEGVVRVVTHCGALLGGVQWDGDAPIARATSLDSVQIIGSDPRSAA